MGQRIQELRKRESLSQEALGEALGVSRQAISKWEGDLTIPELDKLIAMSRLFGVSLDQLLLGKASGEKPPEEDRARSPRDRRLIRLLAGLCAALLVVSMGSLVGTLYFRHQLLTILNPPAAPTCPVEALEYAVRPNGEDMTYDLALALTGGEALKGWDVKLSVATLLGRDKKRVAHEQPEVTFKDGSYSLVLEGLPFGYHRQVVVVLEYEKGDLSGAQDLLILEPYGPGAVWEAAYSAQLCGYAPTENPALLGSGS